MQPCGRELYQGWVNLNAGPTATYSGTAETSAETTIASSFYGSSGLRLRSLLDRTSSWDEVKLDMTSYGSAVRTRGWPPRRDLAAAVVSSLEGDTRPTGAM